MFDAVRTTQAIVANAVGNSITLFLAYFWYSFSYTIITQLSRIQLNRKFKVPDV